MDVLTCAWRAAGEPHAGHRPRSDGMCARCGSPGDLVPARSAVSRSFTGYDGWINAAGTGLCQRCCWGYTHVDLRRTAHLVTRRPAHLTALRRGEVADLLRLGPLDPGLSLVVPLKPGRKHLLPSAVWGRVCVEDAHLAWTAADADRLQVLDQLRAAGFGSRMLASPAPAFSVLAGLPGEDRARVMGLWHRLDPWRTPANPWLAVAVHISVPTPARTRSVPVGEVSC